MVPGNSRLRLASPPACATLPSVRSGYRQGFGNASAPRVLITATHVDLDFGDDFAWGADNISTLLTEGCTMHDIGCLPVLYPRPHICHYTTMHSGYYGQEFEFCPPYWFIDGNDTTVDGSQYGFIELTWRIYLDCSGPSETEAATWGDIKSMYR